MRRLGLTVFLLAPLVAAACSDAAPAPPATNTPLLSHDISISQLGQALESGPARVEVKLESGTLVAREVEIKTPDEMTDEESLRGAVSAVTADDVSGTLTLVIGGLAVGFTASTQFRDADGASLTLAEFVAHIQDALAAGGEPPVRAERDAPAEPQAPDDATFQATKIRILDGLESPKLELNVDADNFAVNDTPPPDAFLRVLGLEIEIRSTTEIGADDDSHDEGQVRGMVASVDLDAGSVTLADGSVILIVDQTTFEGEQGDDHEGEVLGSLDAVAQALTNGQAVKAHAEGAVQSTDPLTILAREVEFEVQHEGGMDNEGNEVHGMVASVDQDAGSVTLQDGTVILITDQTTFGQGDEGDDDGGAEHLTSLAAVAQALTDGLTVKAEAEGATQSTDPLTILADKVEFEVEHSGDQNGEAEARGMVASVDQDAGSVTLEDGTVILITDSTSFDSDGSDGAGLASLAAVAQALADGKAVAADAEGTVESTDPLTIQASEVRFEVQDSGGSGG